MKVLTAFALLAIIALSYSFGDMKTLAKRIRRELENEIVKVGHCAIYEDELQRLWPIDEENRKQKIAHFANENGFKLSFYRRGLCDF